MCGIAGLVDQRRTEDERLAIASRMMDALSHRGPDNSGRWSNDSAGVAFAHRRLAIQDLSATGAQPMLSHSKRYCIALNGEIYNFVDLASELTGLGHIFRGHSDTEVLLAALDEWGFDHALRRLVGMFAFSLWDEQDRTLHLCRDRMGEKPLYYGWLGSSFFFASELKAVEAVAERSDLVIDEQALALVLKYGYIPAPYSIYKGIYKLPPGSTFTFNLTKNRDKGDFSPWPDEAAVGPKTYWSVETAAGNGASDQILDEEEALHELEHALKRSVARQLISDVDLGAFLSGGVDSSAVCGIAQSLSEKPIKTYTVGFDDSEFDESKYAERVAQHLGTEHLTIRTSAAEALQVVPDLPAIYDEPFADSSQIPTYLVSRLARQHVTVCLSGDGGDELFAGYNRYQWAEQLWSKASRFHPAARKVIGRVAGYPAVSTWDRGYAFISAFSSPKRMRQKNIGLKVQKAASFLQSDSLEAGYNALLSSWMRPMEVMKCGMDFRDPHEFRSKWSGDFSERAMLHDQVNYLPGDNLAKVDRASMAVSLETRLPLLDHELVELCWRLPISMKLRGGTTKWILRKLLYSYVPKGLIERPKMGFSVPVASWLRSELKEWASDLLSTARSQPGPELSLPMIDKVWHEHLANKRDHSQKLWALLMYLAWIDARQG